MNQKKKTILGAVAAIAIIACLYAIYEHLTYVSTDNAMIQGHSLMLSSKVGGIVEKVLVEENQKVKKGETLAQIDDRDYANALALAQAELASAQVRARDSGVQFSRFGRLLKERAISQQQFDDAQARYREQTERAKGAEAQVAQARLNLDHTRIVAPTNGSIAKKSVEVGMLVAPGQALFGFVGSDGRWVTANFKETELSRIRPGQKVSVKVDAIPGKTFHGEVEGISSSTGSMFTLLPPDNATGNFTKVVQRVPVRIELKDLSPTEIEQLKSGLSADVSIRIR